MSEFREILLPNCYYHIYNDANGDESLFENELDYYSFLMRLKKYLNPVTDILSYCLQPDGFNIILKVKTEQQVKNFLIKKFSKEKFELQSKTEFFIEKRLSKICSNFFNSYAKKFNLVHGRTGNLFKRAFRRDIINTNDLQKLINQVHFIPVQRGFVNEPESWKYSSYSSLISEKFSIVTPNKIWKIFGNKRLFVDLHQKSLEQISILNKTTDFN